MAKKQSTTEVEDDRPLSDEERSLVHWMLEHGEPHASSFLPQLEQARVAARCRCGCASINFAIAGQRVATSGGMDILSDYIWDDTAGHNFGAFVFACGGLLAGLELYSLDGEVTPTWLPKHEQLQPFPLPHDEV